MSIMFFYIFTFLSLCLTFHRSIGYKFRPVTAEYNEQLQKFCYNPKFTTSEAEHKIMHGDQVPKGKYPWAVALVTSSGVSYCGGTLISPRHFITARHCIDSIHEFKTILVKVGGVCHSVKPEDGCPRSDMRVVEVEFAAYEPRQAGKEETDDDLRIRNMGHDMAIFQLKDDLTHHFDANHSIHDETRPACLPQLNEPLPRVMHVYGWGNDDLNDEYKDSAHLLEVDLVIYNATTDPALGPLYKKVCASDRMYCMHPKDKSIPKDGARGDSGTGIIQHQTQ